MKRRACRTPATIFGAMLGMVTSSIAFAQQDLEALKDLSLEELLQVEITLVSRTTQRASEAAAAVQVITAEDIRRSGARSIPELLRLATNLEVAQAGSRTWAISARGFNAPFSNKLLVLIDGRTVYTPLFSGVFWDMQDTLIDDIERIEVVSGPGATLWGSNAVNGVINIVTKDARDTQGMLATVGAGNEQRVLGSVRYGGTAGANSAYRVYAKYFEWDDSELVDGSDSQDAWNSMQAGFRIDYRASDDSITVQGDVYDGGAEQPFAANSTQSGANLLARWSRDLTDDRRLQLQTYLDHTHIFAPTDFGDDLDTFDVDAQYEWQAGEIHRLLIGAGYRFTRNEVDNLPDGIAFLPARLDRHLVSAFVQDEMSFFNDRVSVTVGSKFEHNDYTGLEIQPSARGSWTVGHHFLWAALSRAVRTPARIDRDLYFPAAPPFVFAGGPEFDSEKVVTSELGWRLRAHENVFVSVSVFHSDYDDIRTLSPAPPFVTENNAKGRIYGTEIDTTWQPTPNWRVRGGYTLLRDDIKVKQGRQDFFMGRGDLFDPRQQAQVRSSLDISSSIEWDVVLRYVDKVENSARGFATIPSYTALDSRVGWRATPHIEVSFAGHNLLDDRHAEFGFRQVERAFFGRLTWLY